MDQELSYLNNYLEFIRNDDVLNFSREYDEFISVLHNRRLFNVLDEFLRALHNAVCDYVAEDYNRKSNQSMARSRLNRFQKDIKKRVLHRRWNIYHFLRDPYGI